MQTRAIRARNAEQFAIRSKDGIDEATYVSVGGIEQWITIRGQDRANPVLLFLHGGPADVTNPWTFALFAPWEERFTVVQWDQRGAGRTLRRTGPAVAATLILDRIVQDGIEVESPNVSPASLAQDGSLGSRRAASAHCLKQHGITMVFKEASLA